MVPGGGGVYPGDPIQGHPNMQVDQWADDYNLERMRRLSLRQQEETVQASNQVHTRRLNIRKATTYGQSNEQMENF